MRTRVKICGITRIRDATAVAALGSDAIGLVFYEASPRHVTIDQAAVIAESLPPFITVTGLFVNAPREQIEIILTRVRIDLLQFHGVESAPDCRGYDRPYIKAVTMREGIDVRACADAYPDAAGLLLDTYCEGIPGGTGHTFDWSRVPEDVGKPLILAGGLTPHNVADAIRRTRPYAVDVSGGVEAAQGVKDVLKMTEFIRSVNSVKPGER